MNDNDFGSADKLYKIILSHFHAGRIPHAVLVDGGSENERSQTAQLIAKMTVCENPGEGFCGCCRACRKADEKIHPDIVTVTRPEDKKYFAKDQLKTVVEQAFITPNEAPKRIFILSELQYMTVESQNVLLKILEEPPEYTAFVLTADSADAVIGTVLSRVVRVRLGSDAAEYSQKAVETVGRIAAALLSPYEFELIAAAAPLESDKALCTEVLSLLCVFLRDCIALRSGGRVLFAALEKQSLEVSQQFGTQNLLNKYSEMSSLLRLTEGNPNYHLLSAQISSKLKRS